MRLDYEKMRAVMRPLKEELLRRIMHPANLTRAQHLQLSH
jgi:hypothetical protein